jgi:hypothetical protein
MSKVRLPLYLTSEALRTKVGLPYGATQIKRLETEQKYHKGDPFPKRDKGTGRLKGRSLWYTPDVLARLKRRGLPVPEEVGYQANQG